MGAFVLSAVLNALAGLLIAGNAGRSFNELGEPYLLPAIAAGVIIIRLLDSGLSVVQVPPATRNIIFGLVILVMVFLYGRGEKPQT